MTAVARLERVHRGSYFRASGLRGGDIAGLIDPFLGIDHACISAPTFPPHPHVGVPALSYLFLDSETGMENQDSISDHTLIQPGGLHWTAAGKGIVRKESPAQSGKTVHSLQFLVGLDCEHAEPFALTLEPQDVPVLQLPGVKVRVPLGCFGMLCSPLTPPTAVAMFDVSLKADAKLSVPIAANENAFVMPIFGAVEVDGQSFGGEDLRLPVFPARRKPHAITLKALQDSSKVMVFSGTPINQAQGER